MINMNFWKTVRDKWIRDNDPSESEIGSLISEDEKPKEKIEELFEELNGSSMDFDSMGTLDDIDNMMNQLKMLEIEEIPFDALFTEIEQK